MISNISLLKRRCVKQHKKRHGFYDDYKCPICLRDNHGKSQRFENAQLLINHLRGKHPSDQNRKRVRNIVKNVEIAIDLGIISI